MAFISDSSIMVNNKSDNLINNMDPVKIVVVGDGTVGKTSFCISYTQKEFPGDEYVPTVFENYCGYHEMSDKSRYRLTLWDTAGQEDYEKLRPLSYPGSNVFLLCFNVSSINSFQNISTKWFPEIRQYNPHTPFILVATKVDLRDNKSNTSKNPLQVWKKKLDKITQSNECKYCDNSENNDAQHFVTTKMGKKLAKKLKAFNYIECSAKTMTNIDQVIEEAIKAWIESETKKNKCHLM